MTLNLTSLLLGIATGVIGATLQIAWIERKSRRHPRRSNLDAGGDSLVRR